MQTNVPNRVQTGDQVIWFLSTDLWRRHVYWTSKMCSPRPLRFDNFMMIFLFIFVTGSPDMIEQTGFEAFLAVPKNSGVGGAYWSSIHNVVCSEMMRMSTFNISYPTEDASWLRSQNDELTKHPTQHLFICGQKSACDHTHDSISFSSQKKIRWAGWSCSPLMSASRFGNRMENRVQVFLIVAGLKCSRSCKWGPCHF